MKIKTLLILLIFIEILIFSVFSINFIMLEKTSHTLSDYRIEQAQMLKKANQIVSSSNELTRFARTYCSTGDKQYKDNYFSILNMRNGTKVIPENYRTYIYWGLNKESREQEFSKTLFLSSENSLKSFSFTKKELEYIKLALKRSDILALEEIEAFKLFEKNNKEHALELLYSKEYHEAKHHILYPISQFLESIQNRTDESIKNIFNKQKKLEFSLIIIFVLFVFFNMLVVYLLFKKVIEPIFNLRKNVELYEAGIKIDKTVIDLDEMGTLSKYVYTFMDNIENKTRDLEVLVEEEIELNTQLYTEQELISSILNNTQAIIAVIDSNGNMVNINSYGEEYTGYTEKQIASAPYFWSRFLPLDVQDKVMGILENAKKGKIIKRYQNAWFSKNGESKIFEWSNALVLDSNGAMKSIVTVGIDVSNELKAQEVQKTHQKQLELSSEISGLAFWEFDFKKELFTFNKLYYKFLATSKEFEGGYIMSVEKYFKSFIPEESQKIVLDVIGQAYTKNEEYKDSFEYKMTRRDSVEIDVLVDFYFTYSEDGKPLKAYGTKYNLTKQKENERELILAKEKAEKATQSKSEFLANMSHEIRTPLNGVIGLTDLVLQTQLNNEQRDFLNRSLSSSNALLHVINDILDYTKIEANKIDLEHIPFRLDEILSQLTNLFSYQFNNKGIDFRSIVDSNVPNNLIGDPFRIVQILTNLVGNAIKFTQKGSVKVLSSSHNIDAESVKLKIDIEDSGIGISQEKKSRLFKEFSQVDTSNTREYGGTGLGLVISKKLAQLMDGEISVESKEGEGSTFSFELKLKYDNNANNSVKIVNFNEQKKKSALIGKVLLVEDNKTNQIVASINLKKFGLEVEIAENGAIAVEKAKENEYHIILMDLQMPIMDGFEATRKIREFNKNIPIIALSAAVMQEDVKLTQDAGMNQHLAKPLNLVKLYEVLDHYLKIEIKEIITNENINIQEIESIDLKELLERFNNNQDVAYKMLVNFSKDKKDMMNELESLDISSVEFSNLLHNLKGLSGNLSLTDVYKFSATIYQSTDLAEKIELMPKLKESFNLAITSIEQNIVAKLQTNSGDISKYSKAELLELVEKLSEDIDSGSFIKQKRIGEIIEQVKVILNEKTAQELEDYFSAFDYESLGILLENIKEELL